MLSFFNLGSIGFQLPTASRASAAKASAAKAAKTTTARRATSKTAAAKATASKVKEAWSAASAAHGCAAAATALDDQKEDK